MEWGQGVGIKRSKGNGVKEYSLECWSQGSKGLWESRGRGLGSGIHRAKRVGVSANFQLQLIILYQKGYGNINLSAYFDSNEL